MKLCVLASGSSGNCTYIGSGDTHILIDAGLSCRETERRLGSISVDPSVLRAVCITHEHEDHVAGAGVLQRKRNLDLFANSATIEAVNASGKHSGLRWSVFEAGQAFQIGALTLEPFSVPHDAYDPVGFRVSDGRVRLGIVTDMGMVTGLIRDRLKDCDVLIVESNHDKDMLMDSERPWSLKQRISGRHGHLSNCQACAMLDEVAGSCLKAVYLAHISSDCNHGDRAHASAAEVLRRKGLNGVKVELTYQDRPARYMEI